MWNVATGKCLATLEGHSHTVRCVAVLPDGRRVVSAEDKLLKLWGVAPVSMDLSKLALVRTLRGHKKAVRCVAVFPGGRRIVSGSWDGTLKVWDVATGECVATLRAHSRVRCAASAVCSVFCVDVSSS